MLTIEQASRQVFGLAGYLLASASQPLGQYLDEAFVPAYRCGAVPDSHRIPFRRSPWETPPAIDAQHKGLFNACQSKCCGLNFVTHRLRW